MIHFLKITFLKFPSNFDKRKFIEGEIGNFVFFSKGSYFDDLKDFYKCDFEKRKTFYVIAVNGINCLKGK